MKKVFTVLLSVLSLATLLVIGCSSSSEGEKVSKGDRIPAFSLKSNIYGSLDSEELKGKVTLICFFATWCPPCQLELAAVQEELVPLLSENEKFSLVVIGREHTDEELEAYNQKKGFTFPLYPDPDRTVFNLFADKSIPRSYLVDENLKVVDMALGFEKEHFDKMKDKIKSLLNQ